MPWDPDRYLRFADHRSRPGIELLSRVPDIRARRIVDLGCGTGNLTALLAQRWPAATTTGIDSSEKMIERARRNHPALNWTVSSIEAWDPDAHLDLIFSNAALHWVDDHKTLFSRLRSALADAKRKLADGAVEQRLQALAPSGAEEVQNLDYRIREVFAIVKATDKADQDAIDKLIRERNYLGAAAKLRQAHLATAQVGEDVLLSRDAAALQTELEAAEASRQRTQIVVPLSRYREPMVPEAFASLEEVRLSQIRRCKYHLLYSTTPNSSRTLNTNRAGQSATPPLRASATAVASMISLLSAPRSTALLTWYSIQP